MAFAGIDSVVFGTPDRKLARKLFSDWGLARLRDSRSGAVFETGIGSRIVIRPEDSPLLRPRMSAGSNFREIVWGVSSARHLDAIAQELARDREVSTDADGMIHAVDDCGINIGFTVWEHKHETPRRSTSFNSPGHRYGTLETHQLSRESFLRMASGGRLQARGRWTHPAVAGY